MNSSDPDSPTRPNVFRLVVIAAALVEAALWLLLVANALLADEPATRGLDRDAAILGTVVYALSGAPALALALLTRWTRLAAFLVVLPVLALAALAMIAAITLPA